MWPKVIVFFRCERSKALACQDEFTIVTHATVHDEAFKRVLSRPLYGNLATFSLNKDAAIVVRDSVSRVFSACAREVCSPAHGERGGGSHVAGRAMRPFVWIGCFPVCTGQWLLVEAAHTQVTRPPCEPSPCADFRLASTKTC